jgi:hypothetical protein
MKVSAHAATPHSVCDGPTYLRRPNWDEFVLIQLVVAYESPTSPAGNGSSIRPAIGRRITSSTPRYVLQNTSIAS